MKKRSANKKRNPQIEPQILPAKREDSLTEIIEKAAPLIKAWQEGEVKKVVANSEVDKHWIMTEYRFKRFLIFVLAAGMMLVLALCTYLFFTNKDAIAANILTITVTGVISFIGGFGLGKSSVSSDESG